MALSWVILYIGIVLLCVILAILLVSYHKKIAEIQGRNLETQQEIARHLAKIANSLES
ncbi:MAG: hypothetical protein KDI29_12055 [Pseudomonadales bacterium]|nr:hypothetical protein [Pseudomonadales bacterium]